MTFTAFETSNDSSRSVALYLFVWGNTRWAYCNGPRAVEFGDDTYEPIPIEEEPFVQGGQNISEFTFRIPTNLPVVSLFRGTPPSIGVSVTVRSLQVDDVSGQAPIRWIGPISNVRPLDPSKTEILSRINGLRRGGNRLTWGRGCQHFVYGPGCEVDKSLHANTRTITAIVGNVITVDAPTPSENYFRGGFFEWDADGLGTLEYRAIEAETGSNSFRVFGRADGLTVGLDITMYPGCPRNTTVCDERFDNLANYDGLDFMPGKSPFDGQALA